MSSLARLAALTMSAANSADGSSVSYTFTYDEPDAQGQPTGAGRLTTVTEPEWTVKLAYWPSASSRARP